MSQLNNLPTNYITNSYNSSDLAKIIPPIQYAYIFLSIDGSGTSGIVNINNYNATTNYYVLTSFLSYWDGNTNIYNPGALVTALGQLIIYNKTINNFSYFINTTTGDIIQAYACFTIIYVST